MLKNITRLEHKIGERVYHFLCDADSPLTEVKEALTEFTWFAANVGKQVPIPQMPSSEPEVEVLKPEVEVSA